MRSRAFKIGRWVDGCDVRTPSGTADAGTDGRTSGGCPRRTGRKRVPVTIRYANFETVTRQQRIAYTSLDFFLIQKAKELFDKAYDRRMLLRLVGIGFSHLVGGFEQIDLYNTATEQYSLCQSMDNIRNRFGKKSIVLASSLKPNPKTRSEPDPEFDSHVS